MLDFIEKSQGDQFVNMSQQQSRNFAPMYSTQHQNLIESHHSSHQQLQHQQTSNNNELIGYYFGSISRETADWILKTHGGQMDGAYLLRSSGPNDDFVLSLMVVHGPRTPTIGLNHLEVLHYKIVETEDSYVALHGQVGDEKFATIDELIDKAQGVATKPRWPILRHTLEAQILPPTFWGLTIDQVRLAILIKAKQWGFPLLGSLLQNTSIPIDDTIEQSNLQNVTTLNNETIRTLIYKSLHEFQPWFHGKISREEAERRIEDDNSPRDGKFLVRERDNYSYAMCTSHKRTTKHYRVDVLPTGELAIQDGRKFTSLMALVSHYTIMSDGLWCALTEACPRPISNLPDAASFNIRRPNLNVAVGGQNLYCIPPSQLAINNNAANMQANQMSLPPSNPTNKSLICSTTQNTVVSLKAPIKEWLQTINHKWSQLMNPKNQSQSLNSFLFGSQNPLNNHCRHQNRGHHHQHSHHHHHRSQTNGNATSRPRKCKNGHTTCGCISQAANMGLALNSHSQVMQQIPAMPKLALPSLLQQVKLIPQTLPQSQQVQPNNILSSLPQNSGFSLNSQSFIGSPLFAVTSNQLRPLQGDKNSGSSNSGDSIKENNSSREEKLISPAESVSANLNYNPYILNTDTYGSQSSTVVVNDFQRKIPTASSSSSSGVQNVNHSLNCHKIPLNTNQVRPVQVPVASSGHIMCGQHAGPAFRYTNCNDENAFKQCNHRTFVNYRTSDDLQLPSTNTPMAGPAAMAKFVQFQDGQCLRTHRDTRSIQMAYLSSRQPSSSVARGQQAAQLTRPNQMQPQVGASLRAQPTASYLGQQNFQQVASGVNVPQGTDSSCADIDLMDCGEDNEFNNFKYDPKLIKSSSIETLCGLGEDQNDRIDDLSNVKSNVELMKSLQSCWLSTSNQTNDILCPTIPTSQSESRNNDSHLDEGFAFSTVMSNDHDEQYDNMKKKHDLDELTTALLAELTASLKAQVDLKNKRAGIGLHNAEKVDGKSMPTNEYQNSNHTSGANSRELINEFDTLMTNNR